MTLESLMNRLAEYFSGLYYVRQWEGWELGLIASAALILLLLVARWRRRRPAKAAEPVQLADQVQSIGARLASANAECPQTMELEVNRLVSLSKDNGKKKRWGQTAKEMRSFGTLIEDLQIQVSRYKAAEESFKQQLANLKAANERLQRELAARGVQHSDLANTVPLARFGRPQDRMPVQ